MKAFSKLIKKDLESMRLTMLLFTLAIVVWNLYLYSKVAQWPTGLAFGLSTLPFGFIILWTLWEAIQVYRYEWQSGGVYTLLSLPQPGWKLALSKLGAVMAVFTLQALAAFISTWLLLRATLLISDSIPGMGIPVAMLTGSGVMAWLIRVSLAVLVIYWFFGLAVTVIAQTAFVISRLADRFQFLLLLAGFVVATTLVNRFTVLGYYLFRWLPDLPVTLPQTILNTGGTVGALPGSALTRMFRAAGRWRPPFPTCRWKEWRGICR